MDAHTARSLANWLNLTTPLGLALARVGGAQLRHGPRGLWLASGYRWGFPTGVAFTVGDVVVTRGEWHDLLQRRPELLSHEEEHSWQYVATLGLPFLAVYGVGLGWSLLRTGDRAAGHPMERAAGLAAGGYAERPVRPVSVGVAAMLGAVPRAFSSRRPR